MATNTPTVTAEFKLTPATTWQGRPGQAAHTHPRSNTAHRLIVLRWADTGEATLREVKGDANTDRFQCFREVDLGATSSIEDAVAKANALR